MLPVIARVKERNVLPKKERNVLPEKRGKNKMGKRGKKKKNSVTLILSSNLE